MHNILVRPSSLGKIMSGIHTQPIPLTPKQEENLALFREKNSQSQERFKLEKKLTEIPDSALSAGGKTHCEEVWNENHYQFRKEFSNKYTRKGEQKEDASIQALSEYLEVFAEKNETYLKNDFIGGTPDVRLEYPRCTIDCKNVYYPDGLKIHNPHAEESDYIWQVHAYNWLDGKERGYVARILMNPPEEQLKGQIWDHWKKSGGIGEPSEDFAMTIEHMYDFESRLPVHERVRLFEVVTTEDDIKAMQIAVNLFREYYDELTENFKRRGIPSFFKHD